MPGENPLPAAAFSDLIDNKRMGAKQLLIVFIAFLLNFVDGFDVTAMAYTAHRIGEILELSPESLGIVFSAAVLGMTLGAMFIAPLSDVYGRRTVLLTSVFAIGSGMLLTTQIEQLWQLVLIRTITGLGVGGMLATLATIASEYTPEKYRSLAILAITAGYTLGAALGGFVAAPLLALYGWQSVFVAGGVATLFMLVMASFFVPESILYLATRRPKNALDKTNKVLRYLGLTLIDRLPQVTSAANGKLDRANVFSLLSGDRRAKTLSLWATFFFCFITIYFLLSWIPKLVINSGLSEASGVYAGVAFNGGAFIGIVLLGWLASKWHLTLLIGTFMCLGAALMAIYGWMANYLPLLPSLFVIGFFMIGGFTGLYAVAAKLYPPEIRTTGIGWAIGLGRFGAVVGPYIGGYFVAAGFSMEMNFLVFAVPAAVSGVLALFLKVK